MGSLGSSRGRRVVGAGFPVARRTALIVEDDLASAIALKGLLEGAARMKVFPAAGARTTLDALNGNGGRDIGIVVMDIKRPAMNGYDATTVREKPRFARLRLLPSLRRTLTVSESGTSRPVCPDTQLRSDRNVHPGDGSEQAKSSHGPFTARRRSAT